MRGAPLAPSHRVLFTTDASYAAPQRMQSSSAPALKRSTGIISPIPSPLRNAAAVPSTPSPRRRSAVNRFQTPVLPPTKFVKVSMPGSPLNGRSGVVLEAGRADITWAVPTADENQINVMFNTLETVPIDRRCLSPASAMSSFVGKRSAARPHPMTIDSTPDGSRKDRSYTSWHGGSAITNFSTGHENPDMIRAGFKAFWKQMDADTASRNRYFLSP